MKPFARVLLLYAFIGAIVGLIACTPVQTVVAPGSPGADSARFIAKRTVTGADAQIETGEKVLINAGVFIGGVNLGGAALTPASISGFALEVAGQTNPRAVNCRVVRQGVGCDLGTLPARATLTFTMTGAKLSAYATYYRFDEPVPFLLPAEFAP